MTVNAQKMICEAFGYTDPLPPTHEIFKLGKKNEKVISITQENKEVHCSMCGHVHPVGYTSEKGAAHLLKAMIPDTYNECYALDVSNFICEYCGYSLVAYNSPSKSKLGKNMINVLVQPKKVKRIEVKTNPDSDLYGILKKPPTPPFVILVNSRGTVLENMVFAAKPTISKKMIVVTYGMNNLEVSPDEVFECIEEAKAIAAELNIEPTSDYIFNRQDDVKFFPPRKLIEQDQFTKLMGQFIAKYNRDCRLVSKMILPAYLKHHKESKIKKSVPKEGKKESKLFGF